MRRSVSVMRELRPSSGTVDPEFRRTEEKRKLDREKARKMRKENEGELDERDDDMVDDIVDILYSRKYGDETKVLDNKMRAKEEKRARKQAKRERKERKRARKEKKREMKEKLKIDTLKKIEKKVGEELEKRKESRKEDEKTDREKMKKEVSSDSSADSDSSSDPPTDRDDDWDDIPSPAEDGEINDQKNEFTQENFEKISKEFTMKERIRQRLIERESFLPFGSVRFDTDDTNEDYKTDIQKMFENLKKKVEEDKKRDKEPEQDLTERVKAQSFFDAIQCAQDKHLVTDIETDTEWMTAAEDGDSDSENENDDLNIAIEPLKKPTFDIKVRLEVTFMFLRIFQVFIQFIEITIIFNLPIFFSFIET